MDDDFDNGAPRSADDRPRGVSKAKLGDIDLEPKLSIFYRPHRKAALVQLEALFPREAAKIFCERIRSDIGDSNTHSYVVTGGDQSAYKRIFAWIRDCIQTQSIEKFPEIPEPEKDPFTLTIGVIVAGERLGVPAGSLSFHLKKRLNGCARKHLMSFDRVREFYDVESEAYKLGLKDVACTSVFSAWWDARLDESVNPELMEELSDMRDDIQELDHDLHEAFKSKEEEVDKRRAEKKAKKAAEQAGGDEWDTIGISNNNNAASSGWENAGTVVDGGGWDNPAPAAAAGGWDTPFYGLTQATTPATGGLNTENVSPIGNNAFTDWTTPRKAADNDFANANANVTESRDWADEMNDPILEPPQTVPQIHW